MSNDLNSKISNADDGDLDDGKDEMQNFYDQYSNPVQKPSEPRFFKTHRYRT
jgi:hypothetical protein